MIRNRFVLFCATALAISAPLAAKEPLPVPLKLPPGLVETLEVNTAGSYMGDAVRIPNCPDTKDAPFFVCGDVLFGGYGLWNTHLKGPIQIKFYPPIANISHFEISHPFNLTGPDAVLRTPQFYAFGATDNILLDRFDQYSTGDLNLVSGEVTNMQYGVNFFNIWYIALGIVNPKLKAPAFVFPGTYGTAETVFEQRADGLLDFTFYGTTFLPIGNNIQGDPVRLPLPFCGPLLQCGSIQVPGLALHPHLRITTKAEPVDPPCGSKCFPIVPNSVVELTLNTRFSSIGDDFDIREPDLGGAPGIGRSQMTGRIVAQFGEPNGDYIPVAFWAQPPSGFLVTPPAFPVPGLSLGFLGYDEILQFPAKQYWVQRVALTDDPFDVTTGEVNMKTGHLVGGLLWRSFWTTSFLVAILQQNLGRIPLQSFLLRGPAFFEQNVNGQLAFRYAATEYRPFEGFIFPYPDLPDYKDASKSYTAGLGSLLTPFFNMQAIQPVDTPNQTMSGQGTNITSTFNEVFSYSYSVPCDGKGNATFQYTNNAGGPNGGTFKMENLASVRCFNSLTSRQPPGKYDTIVFTGYGTWSKDDDRHIAVATFSTAPDAPYLGIQIDGSLSNVDLKPKDIPVP